MYITLAINIVVVLLKVAKVCLDLSSNIDHCLDPYVVPDLELLIMQSIDWLIAYNLMIKWQKQSVFLNSTWDIDIKEHAFCTIYTERINYVSLAGVTTTSEVQ